MNNYGYDLFVSEAINIKRKINKSDCSAINNENKTRRNQLDEFLIKTECTEQTEYPTRLVSNFIPSLISLTMFA